MLLNIDSPLHVCPMPLTFIGSKSRVCRSCSMFFLSFPVSSLNAFRLFPVINLWIFELFSSDLLHSKLPCILHFLPVAVLACDRPIFSCSSKGEEVKSPERGPPGPLPTVTACTTKQGALKWPAIYCRGKQPNGRLFHFYATIRLTTCCCHLMLCRHSRSPLGLRDFCHRHALYKPDNC